MVDATRLPRRNLPAFNAYRKCQCAVWPRRRKFASPGRYLKYATWRQVGAVAGAELTTTSLHRLVSTVPATTRMLIRNA